MMLYAGNFIPAIAMSDTNSAAFSKSDLITSWFQRVWTEEDASAIDEMMTPDAIVRGMGNVESVGTESFRFFQQSLLRQIGDVQFTVHRTIEDGDWMAALWTLTATHRATGRPVRSSGTVFVEVRDGKFVGGYNHFDGLGLYADIGLLPQDIVPRLLQGTIMG